MAQQFRLVNYDHLSSYLFWKWGQPQWEWGRMGENGGHGKMMSKWWPLDSGPLWKDKASGIHIEIYRNHWFVTWNPLGRLAQFWEMWQQQPPYGPIYLRSAAKFEGKWAIRQQSCTHRMTGRAACETANWSYVLTPRPNARTRNRYQENIWTYVICSLTDPDTVMHDFYNVRPPLDSSVGEHNSNFTMVYGIYNIL